MNGECQTCGQMISEDNPETECCYVCGAATCSDCQTYDGICIHCE